MANERMHFYHEYMLLHRKQETSTNLPRKTRSITLIDGENAIFSREQMFLAEE